mmetsp:Transcript_5046/g.12744  ORF Transcript_5046/g.12744 Transcript_5046/m.12744 type:complete len:446 (+) Transcript_5046:370-1707(+)|eukprot:g1202.t1
MESEDLVASNPYRAPSRASIGAADPYNDTAPYNAPTAKARQSYAKLGRPVSDKNILDAKKAAPPPPAPGSTAVDFPAVTAMGLGLITLLWFLSMTTNKLSDEDYKKLGPGVLGQYGGGCRELTFTLYNQVFAQAFVVSNSVVFLICGMLFIFVGLWTEFVYEAKAFVLLLLIFYVVTILQSVVIDLTSKTDKYQSCGLPSLLVQMMIWLPWQRCYEIRSILYPKESGKKVDDGKISPEAAQMGVTHDTLKAMGCPHEEACHEDVRKRKEKIDQYRLRYREENLSERDRLLQTCPYPALWLFFLIAGIPLLAIGSLFLLQDGMIRNYNAIIVISSCLVGAILGLVIMMIPWVKQKNFRHEPLRKMELALENPDDDDFEMFDVDVGGDGGDAEESADIGGDWMVSDTVYHRYNHNFICKLLFCLATISLASYMCVVSRNLLFERFKK